MQVSKTVKVTVNELATILANTPMVKGMGKIAYVSQLTKPKTLKYVRAPKGTKKEDKIPFTDTVEKKSTYSIILNNEYETVVHNQLKREDKDKSDYKKGINTMPIDKSMSKNNFFGMYENKSGQRLPVIEMKPNSRDKVKVKPTYYLNGIEVDVNNIPDVLPKSYPAENQGTDKEIPWRKVYLSNLLELSIDGTKYVLIK